MGTVFFRTSLYLGQVTTSRTLSISTGVATQIILNSGNQGLSIFNIGSATLVWGDSNLAVNSGNNLYVAMRTEWQGIQDGWSVYVRAESAATLISVSEYIT